MEETDFLVNASESLMQAREAVQSLMQQIGSYKHAAQKLEEAEESTRGTIEFAKERLNDTASGSLVT